MTQNIRQIHEEFESLKSDGVGVAVSFKWIEEISRLALDDLALNPREGVNVGNNVPMSADVQAGIITKGSQFSIDTSNRTISFSLEIFLHLSGHKAKEIIRFHYEIKDAPIEAMVDPTNFEIYFQPDHHVIANHKNSKYNEPDAGGFLMEIGYVQGGGKTPELPDYTRFEQEIVIPLTWLNARGLVLAIFRSLPIPQLLAGFHAIRPAVPVRTRLWGDYLLVWTESAAVDLPICNAHKSSSPPESTTWQLRAGSPAPSSSSDGNEPPFALFFAAQTLVNWHSEFLMPAVMVSQSGAIWQVGWRYDISVGLKSLNVELIPGKVGTDGGGIEAHAVVNYAGVASSWLNLPCGIRIGLVHATLQGTGNVDITFQVYWEATSCQLKSALAIKVGLDRPIVNVGGFSAAGLEDEIFNMITTRVGPVRIGSEYQAHSQSVILDLGTLLTIPWRAEDYSPRVRVGNRSALIHFGKKG